MKRNFFKMFGLTAMLALAGVAGATTGSARPSTDAEIAAMKNLYVRPTEIPFPADNPYAPAKAELGKTLFFDPRLSRSGVQACVSCHNPSFGWEDGHKTAVGESAALARYQDRLSSGRAGAGRPIGGRPPPGYSSRDRAKS